MPRATVLNHRAPGGRPAATMDDALLEERLAALRSRLDEAERTTENIRANLHVMVMEALGRGESPSAVARASGYTRQRLHQLRADIPG